MEEFGGGVAAHAFQAGGQVGGHNGQTGKQDDVVHSVKGGEQRTLLGVVGQAALGGLGHHALAGVTQIIAAGNDNEEDEAEGFGQLMGDMEHDKAGHGQDQVAQDHEGAVLAETPLVLSTMYPTKGSVTPSQIRMTMEKLEATTMPTPTKPIR